MTAVVGDEATAPPSSVDPTYGTPTLSYASTYQSVDAAAARVAAVLVLSTAIVSGAAGIVGVDAPVSLRWVVPVGGVLIVWTAVFALFVYRRGLSARLVVVHASVVASVLLMQRQLVPSSVILDGSNWTLPIASAAVITSQVAFRPPRGPLLGSALIAVFVAGLFLAAPADPRMIFGALTFVIQLVLAAWLMSLLRRGDRVAEASLRSRLQAEVAATVEATYRAEQRRQSAQLHDHGLTTLLMVGLGTIATGSEILRQQAIRDLQAFDTLVSGTPEPPTDTCRLDELLRETVRSSELPIEVELHVPAIVTTSAAATCVAGCVAEALRNTARHAEVLAAGIRAWEEAGHNVVEVVDAGRGFDPESVPASRRGIRESIVGRMTAIGGMATVVSAPGHGTRVQLRWVA
ncbi:MAG: hypothetical protein ICV70_07055 [Jiangellaceae bacterium]|nr:hypothetical protein [Jiangellaceae bacterium]